MRAMEEKPLIVIESISRMISKLEKNKSLFPFLSAAKKTRNRGCNTKAGS